MVATGRILFLCRRKSLERPPKWFVTTFVGRDQFKAISADSALVPNRLDGPMEELTTLLKRFRMLGS